jgi:hypothetical protein
MVQHGVARRVKAGGVPKVPLATMTVSKVPFAARHGAQHG